MGHYHRVPASVTEIGYYAFSGCIGLTSVTISEGVTKIGERAFGGCNNLTSITIPSTVIAIGKNPFPYRYGRPDDEEFKLSTITLLTKTMEPAMAILGDYTEEYYENSGYTAIYVVDELLPVYEWFWGGYYNFIGIGSIPEVINSVGGQAYIVKMESNKAEINVELEKGYNVSEIKVNGNVVYPVSSDNKALAAVSVIKNSNTSFTLVGVTSEDTIEVAYNKSVVTAIDAIEMQRDAKDIYDIYGRKLTATQRGINIIDGKKVIVK